MTDPVAFAEARLSEDETAARAWEDAPWLYASTEAVNWRPVGEREVFYDDGRSETVRVIDVSGAASMWTEAIQVKWDGDGTRTGHIARHDPARALREAEAGRRILARHGGKHWCPTGPQDDEWVTYEAGERTVRAYPCADMLDLLYRWRDHPDYDEAWAIRE